MGIRLDIDLDADGNHTFTWHRSNETGALEVPEALLHHWQAERDAFIEAQARWQQVIQEIEDFLVDYGLACRHMPKKQRRERPPQPSASVA